MTKRNEGLNSFPTGAEELDTRNSHELDEAADRLAKQKKEQERMNLENQRKALLDGIQPFKRVERRRSGRQLNIPITEEEHEALEANARDHGVSMRDLLLTAIRPALTRLGKPR